MIQLLQQIQYPQFRQVFPLVVCFCLPWLLTAQRPDFSNQGGFPGQGNAGNSRTNTTQNEILPDTFGLFYFTIENINEDSPFRDTLLDNFQQYDITRQQTIDYANLGILGSAHNPIYFESTERMGFDIGINPYRLYNINGQRLRYYRQERPYTDLRYVQGTVQSDGFLTARFSRNFANGLNFTLDYNRYSQVGDADQYPNQHLRNTNLGLGLWYRSTNGRYDGFFSVSANTYQQQNNGGIRVGPASGGEFSTPNSAEVFLTDGEGRHTQREIMYTHFYRMGGRRDTLGNYSRAFTLSHQVALRTNTFKNFDDFDLTDTFFYNRFPQLLVDVRGGRFYLRHRNLENSFRLATFRRDRATNRATARRQKDLLEVGITHQYHFVEGEPRDTTVNNLLLTGKIGFQPGDKLDLNLDGQFNILNQVGDYRVRGQLFVDLGVAGELALQATNQRNAPTLSQNRFYLSGREIWNNQDLERTIETNLSATYVLPFVKIALTGEYHLINNYIYFDSTSVAKQLGSPVSIIQFKAQRDIRLGKFRLNNTLAYQTSSEDVVRVPNLFGKHSLFYDDLWFGVLDIQLGADLRYMTDFFPYYFNPITSQFQIQGRQETPFYPNLDAFFNMRVRQFRFFLKWENLTSSFRDEELFYLTAEYPYPNAALRFGIRWRMVD